VDGAFILDRLMYFVPLILSLSVHEFAHAWSAYRLGDDTAARLGRLTLNPIAHADLVGTVLFPLMGVPFGWAKPVPVNPARFRRDVRMGTGMAITAAAGPASNLVLALLSGVGLGLVLRYDPSGQGGGLGLLLNRAVIINVSLALFNLLPIPPLDGSRIVDGFLPYRLRPQWQAVERLAPFLLVGVFLFGWRVIGAPVVAVYHWIFDLSLRLAGA
jgi:Zn-dependent protease